MNDEGAGIHVISRLEKEGLPGADLMDGGTGGFHLLGVLQSYATVIIVDASLDDFSPGHIRVLHPRYADDCRQWNFPFAFALYALQHNHK